MDQIRPLAEEYINSETKTLSDWYKEYSSLELFPGQPVTVLPSEDEIQRMFQEWMQRNREQLSNLICVEWNYPALRKQPRFQDRLFLVASLADFFLSLKLQIPAPVATATMIVKAGLDSVCPEGVES
jgi:hypothetical protein